MPPLPPAHTRTEISQISGEEYDAFLLSFFFPTLFIATIQATQRRQGGGRGGGGRCEITYLVDARVRFSPSLSLHSILRSVLRDLRFAPFCFLFFSSPPPSFLFPLGGPPPPPPFMVSVWQSGATTMEEKEARFLSFLVLRRGGEGG